MFTNCMCTIMDHSLQTNGLNSTSVWGRSLFFNPNLFIFDLLSLSISLKKSFIHGSLYHGSSDNIPDIVVKFLDSQSNQI